ncbi:MAG: hypothetical protein JOZ69_23640, partial [Myxococcales bacterium]|nr:hypothetical protein [Myxococcales bacterium]
LEREAAAVSAAELGGLLCLPYLQGERTPLWDETVRGAFLGIDLTHKRGHLYRALLEGVALGFRDCLSVAEEHGARFDEVTAANGAGRSALLRQTLADALGVPLTWTRGEGARGTSATVVGAAVLAGVGCGGLGIESARAAREWRSRGGGLVRHEPDRAAHERLSDVFARRKAVYAAVRR